jgi:3D-(3,5/4)-trihydroxycyclohexane-1,2-dione acylhydrolase (decyclizing)
LSAAKKPLILAGGGVHYSFAEAELLAFAERHNIPVVETVAGKASLVATHELNAGPIGVTGCESANNLAAAADVVLAVGSRMEDFTTGSWTLFQHPDVTLIGLNSARFDARKRRSMPLVADAREGLAELGQALGDWRADDSWSERATVERASYHAYIDKIAASNDAEVAHGAPVTYAQVVGAVDRNKVPGDYVLAAAGGFPGEVNNGWRADEINSFDCEYGFSCMGYEIAGGWGAKMAMPDREVIVFVGDGSTMMMNSDLYSSVISGHKMIVIICDNGGYAVINRLQMNQGGVPFNNLLDDCNGPNTEVRVDFEMLAKAQGCNSETVRTVTELEAAMTRARAADRTYVIALQTHPYEWTEGGTYWEVGVPETSYRTEVVDAHNEVVAGKAAQRRA